LFSPLYKAARVGYAGGAMLEAGEGFPEKDGGAAPGSLKEGARLYSLKRWELARQELLRVEVEALSAGELVELAYYLGLCSAHLERFDDALLYLEQVVTSGGDLRRTYQCRLTLAYIYAVTRRYQMAEFELASLSGSGFESPQVYSTMAYTAWRQMRFDQAVECYEKALEMDGENATALNGLGFVLADTDIDPARGLRCCRKAVDLKPQSAAYLDSLGWAYYKTGEFGEARAWLRRAREAAPGEDEIREHERIASGGGRRGGY